MPRIPSREQKGPRKTRLAFSIKNVTGTEDFFFFFFYMLVKWLYLFGEFPGLSMAVTDLCPKSIYFFSNGICRDPCFNSSWLVLFCFVFPLPPQPSHLKNLFPAQHVSKWLEWWEVLDAPSFCACSRLLTFQFEVFLALNIHWPFLLLHLPK